MKGVLRPPPTALPARILFLIFKGAINLAVWLVAFSDQCLRKGSLDHTDFGPEPRYVSTLLRLVLKNEGEGILGDEIQHYRNICNRLGKREGDQWLFDETVESLLRLMLRRAFLSYVLASIRSLFLTLSSPCKVFAIRSRAVAFFDLTRGPGYHLGRRLAPLTLLVLALTSTVVLLRKPLSTVENGEKPPGQDVSSNEVALSNPNDQVFTRNPVESANPTRNRPANNRQISKARSSTASTMAIEHVTLGMSDGTRESQESKALPTLPNKPTTISMPLPKGSQSGSYEVILQDSDGNRLATLSASSPDGKSLQTVLNMRPFAANEYRLSVSQKKEEVPVFYRFRTHKKANRK